MCMSLKIQRALCRFGNFCVFWRLHSGLVGAVTFTVLAASPNNAVAQFPGVGSEAPSGVAITAGDDVSSDAANVDTSASDSDDSGIGSNALNGASDFSSRSNYDDGSSGYRSPDGGISTLNLKKEHHRKQLFIEKLRLEFAAVELVERKTGLPFSCDDVPRYLDELRSELKTVAIGAKNGKVTGGALKSIARDASFIETYLNKHLDQLIEKAGESVPRKPIFAILPASPKASLISEEEIDALALKFELAEYGEKALQAMGAKRN